MQYMGVVVGLLEDERGSQKCGCPVTLAALLNVIILSPRQCSGGDHGMRSTAGVALGEPVLHDERRRRLEPCV